MRGYNNVAGIGHFRGKRSPNRALFSGRIGDMRRLALTRCASPERIGTVLSGEL
jgi:hypothetical protein